MIDQPLPGYWPMPVPFFFSIISAWIGLKYALNVCYYVPVQLPVRWPVPPAIYFFISACLPTPYMYLNSLFQHK